MVKRILRHADPETRRSVNEILKYPEDSLVRRGDGGHELEVLGGLLLHDVDGVVDGRRTPPVPS